MTSPQATLDHAVASATPESSHSPDKMVTATPPHESLQEKESQEAMDHTFHDDAPQRAAENSDEQPKTEPDNESVASPSMQLVKNFNAGYASIPTDPRDIEPMPNHLGLPFQMGNADMGAFSSGPDHMASLLGMNNNNMQLGEPFLQDLVGMYAPIPDPAPRPPARIDAFARLEFEDGTMLMNTLSVILGRDVVAQKDAQRRYERSRKRQQQGVDAKEPRTPLQDHKERKYTRSIVSESGGILRNGDDSDDDDRPRKRKERKASKKSKSTGSASIHISRRNSLISDQPQAEIRYNSPGNDRVAPVDPASLQPSPYDCPLIGIHPPAGPVQGYKSISRQHVKIAHNERKNIWEAIILGRNGAFIDDEFYHYDETVPLRSGNRLQIGGVTVRFVLPEENAEEDDEEDDGEDAGEDVADSVETSSTAGEGHLHGGGGKQMSFEFEDPLDDAPIDDTSEDEEEEVQVFSGDEQSENDEAAVANGNIGDVDSGDPDTSDEEDINVLQDENEEEEDDDGEDEDPSQEQVEDQDDDDEKDEDDRAEHEMSKPNMKQSKKRGPGRPPKNGVMSKREQQEAKKAARKKAQKTIPGKPTAGKDKTTGKSKVGRPRKNSREATPPVKTEKRKYTKRKPKEPGSPTAKEDGSDGENKSLKEKKEKKPAKLPRSPSPTFNEEDLTPEQLAKPTANYVTLIHEALSNSPEGSMGLSQIYRAIQRKYPWFVVKTTTNGWQSSVRHNLSQHDAFRKVDRDGKGWKWAIVEGVSIEKEKKQRHLSPPPSGPGQFPQPIYQAGPPSHPMHGPPHGPGMMGPPPAYYGQPPNPYPYHPHGPPPPHNGHQGPYAGHTAQPQLVPPQSGSYSSPYAPKPPVPPPHQQVPNQRPPPPGAPHTFAPQQPRLPTPQQSQRLLSERASQAVSAFKVNLLKPLKLKTDNAETIVDSAINRVLGKSHAPVFPNAFEDGIMEALKGLLSKIPEGAAAQPPPVQNHPSQATTIMRPTFMGQGPSKPGSIPRPPIMTSGAYRPNSSSPVNNPPQSQSATASMSPAAQVPASTSTPSPANSVSASTSLPTNANSASSNAPNSILPNSQAASKEIETAPMPDIAQIAGSKRPLEDPEDRPNVKRLSSPRTKDSVHSTLNTASTAPKFDSVPKNIDEQRLTVESSLIADPKASLGDRPEHYKSLSTTGPLPLKT